MITSFGELFHHLDLIFGQKGSKCQVDIHGESGFETAYSCAYTPAKRMPYQVLVVHFVIYLDVKKLIAALKEHHGYDLTPANIPYYLQSSGHLILSFLQSFTGQPTNYEAIAAMFYKRRGQFAANKFGC